MNADIKKSPRVHIWFHRSVTFYLSAIHRVTITCKHTSFHARGRRKSRSKSKHTCLNHIAVAYPKFSYTQCLPHSGGWVRKGGDGETTMHYLPCSNPAQNAAMEPRKKPWHHAWVEKNHNTNTPNFKNEPLFLLGVQLRT